MPQYLKREHLGKELHDLQNKWYKTLAKTGFKDIELAGDYRMLRHYDSTRFYRVDSEVFGSQQSYFAQAGQFLYDNHFPSPRYRLIWKYHSEGLENTEISKKVHCSVVSIAVAIKRLKAKMLDQLETVITIRNATEKDHNFIYATMLRGVYYGCPQLSLIPKSSFMLHYHRIVETILSLPTTQIRVACLPDDPDCVVGYALGDSRNLVHFIFVKTAWRKFGIGRKLLTSLGNVRFATHLTHLGERLLKKQKAVKFNPFAIGGNENVKES